MSLAKSLQNIKDIHVQAVDEQPKNVYERHCDSIW